MINEKNCSNIPIDDKDPEYERRTGMITMAIIYLLTGFGKRFYHDVLGWHKPSNEQGYDGCSFTARCKYCGKEIMQDSQGNWF